MKKLLILLCVVAHIVFLEAVIINNKTQRIFMIGAMFNDLSNIYNAVEWIRIVENMWRIEPNANVTIGKINPSIHEYFKELGERHKRGAGAKPITNRIYFSGISLTRGDAINQIILEDRAIPILIDLSIPMRRAGRIPNEKTFQGYNHTGITVTIEENDTFFIITVSAINYKNVLNIDKKYYMPASGAVAAAGASAVEQKAVAAGAGPGVEHKREVAGAGADAGPGARPAEHKREVAGGAEIIPVVPVQQEMQKQLDETKKRLQDMERMMQRLQEENRQLKVRNEDLTRQVRAQVGEA